MSEHRIYQIKITLDDIRPPIWRRVQVPGEITLAELHDVIQVAMGWENCHLHEFQIGADRYAPSVNEEFDTAMTAGDTDVKLCDVVKRARAKFRYTYDFGDDWRHTLMVEKTAPPEPGVEYPRCLAGERACPPEDCGGPWGYANLIEAREHPDDPRHAELLEWAGDFDPEAFHPDAVNTRLRQLH